MPYIPPQKILKKYADVLVNFALGWGKGFKKGDVVRITVGESAKPLYVEIRKAVLKAGGHVISQYLPDNTKEYKLDQDFYFHASNDQLSFFPEKYYKGVIDQIDHSIYIHTDTDPHSLKDIDPKKIMQYQLAHKRSMEWLTEKENRGKFTWTIALYGTSAMAKEAGMTLEEYWKQISSACFLNDNNPVKKWKLVSKQMEKYQKRLNALKIDKLHITGPDANLWIKVGEKRRWMGGRGANIPSFELFTSPDWRGTNGWIRFNQPLYTHGNLITGVELEFKNGVVVKSKAKKGEKFLKAMLATPNADKIGEYSLTDKRFSKITKFMAETLYDENIGGPNGNTHLAVGKSYHDCFNGQAAKMKKKDWEKLGFNDSVVHTDIISTAPRIVTAHWANGRQKVIYKNGQFVI